ncbi:MAG: hypothetical protein OXF20_01970 [Gammaproteobacteria bacterium]|nr:hypothetical protein [Gammaproteobacteria bacterium]
MPIFTVYVVWHQSCSKGQQIADLLGSHFVRNLHRDIGEDRSISVLERSIPMPGLNTPLPIDWDDTEYTVAVVLADSHMIKSPEWIDYVLAIEKTTVERGLLSRLFPVTVNCQGLELDLSHQALRWDKWVSSDNNPEQRLISELTHEFCRMLRHINFTNSNQSVAEKKR